MENLSVPLLRDDQDLVHALMDKSPPLLRYASDRIKDSMDIVGNLALKDSFVLCNVSYELRADIEILKLAVGECFSEWENRILVLRALRRNGLAIKYAS